MKKIFLLSLVLFLTTSCKTHRYARLAKTDIRGDWKLTQITYDKQGLYKINLFDIQSKECLENSLWHFVTNNTSGYYQYKNNNCPDLRQNFYFTIEQASIDSKNLYILIKPVDAKRKSVDNHGYRLKLVQLTKNNMRWNMKSQVNGKAFIIHLDFQRNKQ
jgi:hypothetical protein